MCFSKVRMNPLLRNCVASNLSKHVWINMTAYSRNLKRKKVSNFPLLFLRRINCLSINTIYHFCTLLKQHAHFYALCKQTKRCKFNYICKISVISMSSMDAVFRPLNCFPFLKKVGLPMREYFAIHTV